MRQSESEIREVSGINAEAQGLVANTDSGRAKELMIQRSQVMTATLLDNLRRSMKMLGDQLVANIQGEWKAEKVLRITDRLTGAEKFVELNQRLQGPNGETIEVKNDITQGRYDVEISESPITDTIREKSLETLVPIIQQATPEMLPVLLRAIIEISNLPNKDTLLEKLNPVLGVAPGEEDMSPEELRQKAIQVLEAQQQEQAKQKEMAEAAMALELAKLKTANAEAEAKIAKLQAETAKIIASIAIDKERLDMDAEKAGVDAYVKGADLGQRLSGANQQEPTKQ
jgi:hypothetical protein